MSSFFGRRSTIFPSRLIPVVEHLYANMNPGGSVLSFFHMKTEGPNTAFCRFHLTEGTMVKCSRAKASPFSGRLPIAVSSACFRGGQATASSLPRTASPKSS